MIYQPNDGRLKTEKKVMQSEKEMAESAVSWTLFALVLALIGCAMTGCMGDTGWRFTVGVAPVSQIRDVASLQGNQSDTRTVKRAPAPKSGATAEDDY